MDLSELLPTLHAPPRPGKWRLVQIMVADLAREEEGESPIEPGVAYPVWSPYDAFDAADALLKYGVTGLAVADWGAPDEDGLPPWRGKTDREATG